MATWTDSNGIHYVLPDSGIMGSGNMQAILNEVARVVIRASDLDDVVNYYRRWFGVNWASRSGGSIITADDHNQLRQAIINSMGGEWTASLPGTQSAGNIVPAMTWGPPSPTFQDTTYTFNAPGTYKIWLPAGAGHIHVVQMIAGGGGGGLSWEAGTGETGGSGGSGGYRSGEDYDVGYSQWLTVIVGAGGNGFQSVTGQYPNSSWISNTRPQTSGGDTYLNIGGNNLAYCIGGGYGSNANASSQTVGAAGSAGSPNGNRGNDGVKTANDHGSRAGVNGANSQMGTGGVGGAPWSSDATGYGAGGASGGFHDRTQPYAWPGTNGSGGYCQIIIQRRY